MTNSEKPEARDEIQLGDLFRPLLQYRRLIWQGTLVVTATVALLGGLYMVFQPRSWTATVGFRPVFEGADSGEYPNGLPFAATDVTDASIVSAVFTKNELQSYWKSTWGGDNRYRVNTTWCSCGLRRVPLCPTRWY
jgi:hypothetical protein